MDFWHTKMDRVRNDGTHQLAEMASIRDKLNNDLYSWGINMQNLKESQLLIHKSYTISLK